MSDDTRGKDLPPEGGEEQAQGEPPVPRDQEELPDPDDLMPKDQDLYTPQGGGGGTGSGPIQEVSVVRDAPRSGPKEDLRKEVPRPGGMTLPQVADKAAEEDVQAALGTPGVAEGDAGGELEKPEVSSFRLLMTLGLAGMLAGALLVFVFLWTDPLIKAEQARVMREAVTEVLKGPERFESVFIVDGQLMTEVPAGVDTLDLDKVFLGYDGSGNPVGFAMTHARFGFQDLVTVIFGYDPDTRQVLGMKVLDHSETPGLGNKIEEEPFVSEFNGVTAPIEGVKPDRNTGAPNQVDMITSVTISSKAVINTINERIEQLGDLLEAYQIPPTTAGGGMPTSPRGGEDR